MGIEENNNEVKWFTLSNAGKLDKLTTPVTVNTGKRSVMVQALWDTGATRTCISEALAKGLGLHANGSTIMCTPQGMCQASLYDISIDLPNSVTIPSITAVGAELSSQSVDMLIGMDIIMRGRMMVSYKDGVSSFTFMLPSPAHADLFELQA